MGDKALAEAQPLTAELTVPGELTLVSGPTGSGKTTLLSRALRDWRAAHPARWPGAVLLGQNPATQLVAETVEEEIAFALVAAQMPDADIARRTARALATFGLDDRAKARTDALSMGWKCRTLLGALHALEPDALFLDEPYAQLDDSGRRRLDAAITEWLGQGRAVVVSAAEALETEGGLPSGRTRVLHATTGLRPEPDLVAGFCKRWTDYAPVASAGPAVELVSFTAGYEDTASVLRNIDLVLPPGSITAVSGANGCGKSTLLRAVAGDMPTLSGTRRILGRDMAGAGNLARETALVLQDPELRLTGRTVRGEIEVASAIPKPGAETCLRIFGLSQFAEQAALTLSHGQKQALVLACAVASMPRLLLLDEAFCGLDAGAMASILSALRRIVHRTGLTVIAVTHDPQWPVPDFADRHLRMSDGKLIDV